MIRYLVRDFHLLVYLSLYPEIPFHSAVGADYIPVDFLLSVTDRRATLCEPAKRGVLLLDFVAGATARRAERVELPFRASTERIAPFASTVIPRV